jgi:hypothetical protein
MSAITAIVATGIFAGLGARRGSANQADRLTVELAARPIPPQSNKDMFAEVLRVQGDIVLRLGDIYSLDVGLSTHEDDWKVVEYAADFLRSLRFPLKVYRGLHLPPGKKVRTRRRQEYAEHGEPWTTSVEIAEAFARMTHAGQDSDEDHGQTPVVLSSWVNAEDVDWRRTVLSYLIWTRMPHQEAGMQPQSAELQISAKRSPPVSSQWVL